MTYMYNLLQSQVAEIRGIKLLEGPGAWHGRPAPQGDRAGMDHEDWSLITKWRSEGKACQITALLATEPES